MDHCETQKIETERLILRPFQADDAEDVFALLSAQTVHCFQDMKPAEADDVRKEIGRLHERPEENYFAVCLKESGKVIGELFTGAEEDGDTASPCWMLHPDYQGKGYAFEAVHAYFDYLFYEKKMRRLYAYTEEDNKPSRKLCERLGMRQEGMFLEFISFVNDPDGTPLYENTVQYAILKKEWERQSGSEGKY